MRRGATILTLSGLVDLHHRHLAGHGYQVRYVRGAFSRAHGTDEAAFDPC
jgi:hypothetical protein